MKKKLQILIVSLLALATAAPLGAADGPESIHDFTFTAIEGHELDLDAYRGQAVLLVNTASFCGFTYQYDGLQALWDGYREAGLLVLGLKRSGHGRSTGLEALYAKYRDRGLVVLGVPSDDFNQEPGDEAEIKDFCEVNFGLNFPMTKKQTVKGPGAHPVYRWTAEMLGREGQPRWNFHKILFDRSGQPVAGFNSSVEPQSERMIEAVEAALAGAGS